MVEWRLSVDDSIRAQVSFWRDTARVRGFVGGIGSGKTFAGAVEVLTMPGGTTGMVVAPSYKILRDASQATFFEICPPGLIEAHNKSENRTDLANGTTIVWRSADDPNSLRGPNLSWAWGDEYAFVSEESHRVLVGRLRRSPGRMWFTTTPNGQNWLYQWSCVRDLGYSLHYSATRDNHHLLDGYVESLVAQYADDPHFAAQELEGRFIDLSGTKRLPGLLLDAATSIREPLATTCPVTVNGLRGAYSASQARVYIEPRRHSRYVIGVDPAEGVPGGDDTAIVVLDAQTRETACVLAGQYEPTEVTPGHIAALAQWYNGAAVLVERNNHGHAVIGGCARHGVHLRAGDDGRTGWRTTTLSKATLYRHAHDVLLDAFDGCQRIMYDQRTVDQLRGIDRETLRGPGKGKLARVDDLAVAWALAATAAVRRTASVADQPTAPNVITPPRRW